MGTADALPGVSGGTIALLLGIYERLIIAISKFTPRQFISIILNYRKNNKNQAHDVLQEMDLAFLLSLGLGMLTAVLFIANAVARLADSNPVALFGFFTGLIAASALVLYRDIDISTKYQLLAAFLGFSLAFTVGGGAVEIGNPGHFEVFLVGAIAISAMVLPGISGSLLLLLMGQYVYLSSKLTQFATAVYYYVDTGSWQPIVDPGTTIIIFVLGGVTGVLIIARIVRIAFARFRQATLAFLVSLIAGSVRAPLSRIGANIGSWTGEATIVAGWILFGGVVLFGLDALVGGFEPE